MNKEEKFFKELLKQAGITLNGDKSYDIKINNPQVYSKILKNGSLGVGESYMDKDWDCEKLDEALYKIFNANLQGEINSYKLLLHILKARMINLQSIKGSKKVIEEHYDLSNDLYMSFLDPYNQYTCGYFKNTNNLNKAQEQKLDLLCKKLQLKKGDKVLDIGCGWGGFAKYAAKNYGCHVTGISISNEQIKYAQNFTKGLPVTIKKEDYRYLNEKFDKIISVGMLEHVGYKNYKRMMKIVHNCLKDDGIFLLHTIGNNRSVKTIEPWISKYIFPGAMLPSIKQIANATENLFIIEDWHNIGQHYDKTLMAWHKNFEKNYHKLNQAKFNERFKRMWNFYLLSCAALFRARKTQLWQIVMTKKGLKKTYERIT